MGLAMNRFANLPFQSWELKPQGPGAVSLTLIAAVVVADFTITVSSLLSIIDSLVALMLRLVFPFLSWRLAIVVDFTNGIWVFISFLLEVRFPLCNLPVIYSVWRIYCSLHFAGVLMSVLVSLVRDLLSFYTMNGEHILGNLNILLCSLGETLVLEGRGV